MIVIWSKKKPSKDTINLLFRRLALLPSSSKRIVLEKSHGVGSEMVLTSLKEAHNLEALRL